MRLLLPVLAATVMLTGCASESKKVEELQGQVKALQMENDSLKARLHAVTQTTVNIDPKMQTAPLVPAEPASAVDDLAADVPNADLIADLVKLKVFENLAGKFEPYKPVTRAEYCTWLFKANNAIVPKHKINLVPAAKPFFKDLEADAPCYPYVQALKSAGYSVGYEDGTFRPDQPITREEMISMKVGFDRGKDVTPNRAQLLHDWKFSDTKAVADKYTGLIDADIYVYGPKGNNVQRAFGKVGAFRPQEPVLRCEAAGTLWQIGDNVTLMGTAPKALQGEPG